jgi:hypothetical protein
VTAFRSQNSNARHSFTKFIRSPADSCVADALRRAIGMWTDMRFVYMLRSLAEPSRYYVGLTSDVAARRHFV